MDNNECVSIEHANALRTAIADGDVTLYDVEHTLQQRKDEELSKPAHEVDGDLVLKGRYEDLIKNDVPKTGDDFPLGWLVATLVVILSAVMFVLYKAHKTKKKQV